MAHDGIGFPTVLAHILIVVASLFLTAGSGGQALESMADYKTERQELKEAARKLTKESLEKLGRSAQKLAENPQMRPGFGDMGMGGVGVFYLLDLLLGLIAAAGWMGDVLSMRDRWYRKQPRDDRVEVGRRRRSERREASGIEWQKMPKADPPNLIRVGSTEAHSAEDHVAREVSGFMTRQLGMRKFERVALNWGFILLGSLAALCGSLIDLLIDVH
jgi:hypothetical protein